MTLSRRAALALLSAAPLACTRPKRRDGALEMVIPTDPATLDPRFVSDVYGLRIARLTHAALVTPHPDTAEPMPWLAESIVDEPDGALVAVLRRGARFHDGSLVRAIDVVETFRALGDPALGSPSRRIVAELAAIEAVDERTVRIRPKSPRATLRADLDVAILKADEARSVRDAALTGAGPFRVASRATGELALDPAANYDWFEAAARHRVVIRTVRDEPARALRMIGGSVDIASNVLAPALAFSLPSRSDAPSGLRADRRPAAATTFLAMQCARPPLDAAEVRRAISATVDRASLIAAKLGGAATPANGMLPPTIALAPRNVPPLAFDPAGARSVLAPLGARGVELTLVTSTDRLRVGIARAIAQALGDAGLPTTVRTYEFATFFARLSAGDFDLAPLIASEVTDPDVLRWYLHSDALPPRGANRARLRDPRIDALLDRGLRTIGPARREAYEELETVLRDAMPYAPLFHEDHVVVTSARASSFRPSVDGRWGALTRC